MAGYPKGIQVVFMPDSVDRSKLLLEVWYMLFSHIVQLNWKLPYVRSTCIVDPLPFVNSIPISNVLRQSPFLNFYNT